MTFEALFDRIGDERFHLKIRSRKIDRLQMKHWAPEKSLVYVRRLPCRDECQMKPIVAMILAASVASCLTGSKRQVLRSKNAVAAALISLHLISLHLISLHAVSPVAAQTPADIARAARGLPESMDLQTELPLLNPDAADEPRDLSTDLVRVLLWTAVIAGAGVLAYYIYEVLPAGAARRQRWDQFADGADGAVSGADAAARAAADELAAQGRFVEAMHVLLLQGLDEMRMRLDLRFADSLTSREIVSRANAPAGAKAALRDIIRWVEGAYFGDHPVDRNDYDACRRSYLALDSSLRAGGRE
jgi:hypothetical protein